MGTVVALVYRRLVTCLWHIRAVGAIAQRLCRLILMILHHGIRYEERGPVGRHRRLAAGAGAQDDPGRYDASAIESSSRYPLRRHEGFSTLDAHDRITMRDLALLPVGNTTKAPQP
jgi:hypothetical protein